MIKIVDIEIALLTITISATAVKIYQIDRELEKIRQIIKEKGI